MKRIVKLLVVPVLLAAGLTMGAAGSAQAATPTCTSWHTYRSALYPGHVIHVPSAGHQTGRDDCLLRQGNAGDAVTVLQRALRYCSGRNIAIDSEYGPQTHSAVLWFQRHINDGTGGTGGGALVEDGIYGPATKDWMAFPVWRWPANTRTDNCENIPV